ncbi:putative hypothetical protein [Schistosoma mansoni]|uniref:HlyD family secretion protein n=1 Tax=Schistosoma mansoni TaxID=6183 RepID=G4VQ81_SCHMA|nr:putative hypothetical protein [Schistosoma mansoni]|eukprot:XP_018655101.1 putative hypothetical protein [Schistosoma mansoni]
MDGTEPPVGRVETGIIKPGMVVTFAPQAIIDTSLKPKYLVYKEGHFIYILVQQPKKLWCAIKQIKRNIIE